MVACVDPGLKVVQFKVLKLLENCQSSGLHLDRRVCNSVFFLDVGLPKKCFSFFWGGCPYGGRRLYCIWAWVWRTVIFRNSHNAGLMWKEVALT